MQNNTYEIQNQSNDIYENIIKNLKGTVNNTIATVNSLLNPINDKSKSPNCNINLNDEEAQCYLNQNPELIKQFGATNIVEAKKHWNNIGCNENKKYKCPAFDRALLQNDYRESEFQEKLKPLYIGCFNDNPIQPSMEYNLGNVNNQLECINKGIEKKLKYVGLLEGNVCMGTSNDNFIKLGDTLKYNCNSPCNDANTGYCGGYFFNQVYKTSLQSPSIKLSDSIDKTLEHFVSTDNELKEINNNLSYEYFKNIHSVDSIQLFLWLIIIVMIIYIIIEYSFNKKNNYINYLIMSNDLQKKFIPIKTINNNGVYKNYTNCCLFISLSCILNKINEYDNINPENLRKLCNFKGNNNSLFDCDIHCDDNFLKMLNHFKICIVIYPFCYKYNSINLEIYEKICANNKYKYVIPIVNYCLTHFEPIINTQILFEGKVILHNIINNSDNVRRIEYNESEDKTDLYEEYFNIKFIIASITKNYIKILKYINKINNSNDADEIIIHNNKIYNNLNELLQSYDVNNEDKTLLEDKIDSVFVIKIENIFEKYLKILKNRLKNIKEVIIN